MKILVINRGSSTLKCALYQLSQLPDAPVEPLWKITLDEDSSSESGKMADALRPVLDKEAIDCVGHRVVQGGKNSQSLLITSEVKQQIRALADLAPLHNMPNLEGVELIEKLLPDVPQVAVFDTAFHHTLPIESRVYPGPYEWVEQGIQRYGFHGISFQYCTRRVAQLLADTPSRMVICHLGSGASLCAVKDGVSIDTTMGFTPLEGLMMDTRSGTVDPGILLYLLETKTLTVQQLSQQLNQQSGLLGLSGISGDMRKVLEGVTKHDERAQLAIDVYIHRLTSMIGAMIASLGGIDTLVFTGGIGENATFVRSEVCRRLSFLGVALQEAEPTEDSILSTLSSKVRVLVVHTQEALEIARECLKVLSHHPKTTPSAKDEGFSQAV